MFGRFELALYISLKELIRASQFISSTFTISKYFIRKFQSYINYHLSQQQIDCHQSLFFLLSSSSRGKTSRTPGIPN